MTGQTPELSVKVSIAGLELNAPPGHTYTRDLPPTYDYGPWEIIGSYLDDIENLTLVDVGANIGDSVAHWRRYSTGPCICVEADDQFFEVLSSNLSALGGDIDLVHALLTPETYAKRVNFQSASSTGFTQITEGVGGYTGPTISCEKLLQRASTPVVFKTDTDGFDDKILGDLLGALATSSVAVPIVFAEGPTADQVRTGEMQTYVSVVNAYQELGYRAILLDNRGTLFAYCGTDALSVEAAFHALHLSCQAGYTYCHYFDILLIDESIKNPGITPRHHPRG